MIFRRKDRDRGNPTDLLHRLRSLHDLLDPTTENTGEEAAIEHPERGRKLTGDIVAAVQPASPGVPPATFDDDVPLLTDVVTSDEISDPARNAAPVAPPTPFARPLTGDAEVVRALAAFELAVSRHLGDALDATQKQSMRREIRKALTRMLGELETRWKEK